MNTMYILQRRQMNGAKTDGNLVLARENRHIRFLALILAGLACGFPCTRKDQNNGLEGCMLLIPLFLGPHCFDKTLCCLGTSVAEVFMHLAVLFPNRALSAYACNLLRDTDETAPVGTKKALPCLSGAVIVGLTIGTDAFFCCLFHTLHLLLDREFAKVHYHLFEFLHK